MLITLTCSMNLKCDTKSKCGCPTKSSISVNQKIIGGEEAPDEFWTWMTSLRFLNSHICGASLITPEFAITAAHCVEGLPSSLLSIVINVKYLSKTSDQHVQHRIITSVHMHPGYDSTKIDNDIALIQFSSLNVTGNWKFTPVCLPSFKQDPFKIGDKLVATGWGTTKEGGDSSDVLRQVTLKVMPSNSKSCIAAPIQNPAFRFCAGLEQGGKGIVTSQFT